LGTPPKFTSAQDELNALEAELLLLERLRSAQQTEPSVRAIPPVSRDRPLPLSFAQQRLWFLNQLLPGNAAYNIFNAVQMSGRFTLATLKRAFDALIQRHEALRTTFAAGATDPVQVIAPALALALPVVDLSRLGGEAQQRLVQRLATAQAQRPFDLVAGPLLHATLLRVGAHEHLLLLSLHHAIADGWSMGIFIRELVALYESFASGQPSALPPLPIQYADYAVWQRAWVQGAVLEEQLAYWKRQLAGAPTVLNVLADRPRPPVQTLTGATEAFALPDDVSAALQKLSRDAEATLFTTLLAAFNVLLFRYSGQADILVGAPIANRTRAEIEPLIGCFVNTLVLRTDLAGDPHFHELVGRVRATTLGAFGHADLPFEMLVEQLHPPRDLSRSPFFQVMFVLNLPPAVVTTPGLTLRLVEVENGRAQFDLTLFLTETPHGLVGSLEYNTALFDAATIKRLAGHYRSLLAAISAAPARPIADLPLLSAAEQRQLLVEWNATTAAYPYGVSLHSLFAAQVTRMPDAIAVVFDETNDGGRTTNDEESGFVHRPASFVLHLSYADLNRHADALAARLRRLGVGTGVIVGLCVERSPDMVVALLGVLKAGGAFLPLDPADPAPRLAAMLQDSGASIVLAHAATLGTIATLIEDHPHAIKAIVALDGAPRPLAFSSATAFYATGTPDRERSASRHPRANASDLAYLMYTSGSTGQPKGVLIAHGNLVPFFLWYQHYFDLRADDRIIQYHSLSFDFSTWEIFETLLCGACLYVVPALIARDVEALADRLRRAQITMLNMTPAQFSALSAQVHPRALASLRRLVLGGEALPPALAQRAAQLLPRGCRLYNEYGPTETTISSAILPITLAAAARYADCPSMPIGRPIGNSQIYLLDRRLHPVPIGVVGDLYIGGVGLARGYLNRPDLTAERFVPNPFLKTTDDQRRAAHGARLYRTGDLARSLGDGVIAFLGRVDQQVKLRGYRIEPGEIAAVIAQHPAVRAATVVVREEMGDDKRLVAYVVPTNDERRTTNTESDPSSFVLRPSSMAGELRAFLAARLPAYMLPATFVLLDALPLTPSGKVDRKALPLPPADRSGLTAPFAAPQTPAEELLANLWAQLLRIERLGRDDNFFELGGHSLLATQLTARVREAFHVELPVRSVFAAPTVAGLAAQIAHARQENLGVPIPPLRPAPRAGALPLSFAQQRLWFLDQLQPHSPVYNVPAAVRLAGPLDLAALKRSISAIVRRHEALRTTFAILDGRPVQVIAAALALPLPLVDLGALAAPARPAAAQQLATREAQHAFDLAHGPLIRVTLLRLGPTEHVALLTLHHIVADGWSMGVLIGEFGALYAAFRQGAPTPLPELPIQYADYTLWQRQWLHGALLERQLSYWTDHLAALPTLHLPTDRPRPARQTFHGTTLPVKLGAELSQALLALSRAEGATLFMTLLALWQVLLMRYSGQIDLAVGAPIANRTRPALEGLIGCFVNTLVLRGDLSGEPSFRETLRRVREVCLTAYAHQDLPFEQLVEALQPARDLSRHPLFQVLFALQNAPLGVLELPDLVFELLPLSGATTKFDLSLALFEGPAGLEGVLEYCTDLFDASTITRLLGHLRMLAEGIVADPARALIDLPLLTAAARQQLLVDWNATPADDPQALVVHQLFEAQVARTPDAVAVVCATVHLSYHGLNVRANHLAHHLRHLGVAPDVRVGLALERSLEQVIALLGILKAGGAYVPLDPAYPAERLRFMLQDAQLPLLVTQHSLTAKLPAADMARVWLDQAAWLRRPTQRENPVNHVAVDHLAYVIYTSGSSGQPKGTLLTQRGLGNIALDQARRWQVQAESRVLQFAALSFDAATSEIFMTLLGGATLCLGASDALLPSPALLQLMDAQAITTVTLPPSALAVLPPAALPRLRTLIVAGEACPPELVARWAAGRQFINAYGPTEATIAACYAVCSPDGRTPLIGRAFANVQLYVLDARGQPVPLGVSGELYIGGVGLARGYLNRPDLTAARFVPNPFVDERRTTQAEGSGLSYVLRPASNTRLYRTGDRVRYRPDGRLEFLGRVDQQIKLRGYRIELGEIAAVLVQHPAVCDAVVLAREDAPGDLRLVAYVVPRGDERRRSNDASTAPSSVQRPASVIPELRAFLHARLPDYMIPAIFVLLAALPLTPSGKIDRQALPAPDAIPSGQEAGFVAPRTPIEDLLAQIWATLLRLERVSIHDRFFDLGGHSLLATQVIARVQAAFGVELPLRSLFETPTIAELAERITAARREGANAQMPPLRPVPRNDALPLSFAQQRLWFLDQLVPENPFYNLPAAVRLRGQLNVMALHRSLNEIVRRHEALRTTFVAQDGRAVQVIAPASSVAFAVVDLQALSKQERTGAARRRAMVEARQPFDLARGPLLRTTLLRLDEEEHLFLLTMHHIVSDGWSIGVFIQETAALYAAFCAGKRSPLPELPIQYADYAVWQREWLRGAVLETQLAYWQQQLADLPVLQLPTDYPRPALTTFQGARHNFAIPQALIAELAALSRREGVTLFMTLLAAFQTLLARYTGQNDIVVGSPIANRSRTETEGLIGFFVNR
jgi:amino acid adenylation domain-containing protein